MNLRLTRMRDVPVYNGQIGRWCDAQILTVFHRNVETIEASGGVAFIGRQKAPTPGEPCRGHDGGPEAAVTGVLWATSHLRRN